MKEIQLYALQVNGGSSSAQPVELDDEGNVKVGIVAAVDADIRDLTPSTDGVRAYQVSGDSYSVFATDFDIRDLTEASDSIRAYQVSGGTYSTLGNAVARTTNPTAASDATQVQLSADKLGRGIMTPIQARELRLTAYASVTGGTETTLLAGVAGSYLDLVMLTASNNSDAAVSVDIRAVTAGNIVHTMRIPANSTAGWAPAFGWPQDATGNNWTVDGPDETGRTLTFSALFSQES